MENNQNETKPATNSPELTEKDNFKLRRITAFLLIGLAGLYLAFGDHNKTIELIMLALAQFVIGISIVSKK